MRENNFAKILVIRTDRIGDVLISTPVLKCLRRNFPQSYIAVMVRPYAQDIVLGNPYLDEVIIYDKYVRDAGLFKSIKFILDLKKRNFDLALILHPTNRVHLIAFFAGIKRRIGFNRKMGFLLTDKVEHQKQLGLKHELDYTLDILRALGIKVEDETCAKKQDLFMPIRRDSQVYIEELLRNNGLHKDEKVLAIHPMASCPSKIWPIERFVQVAERLSAEFNLKVIVVAGPDDAGISKDLTRLMHCPFIDATGKTTVSQLASLLKRCTLFISNDSGPVHIAQAQGVPTVAIFGRRQPGLSPRRWGPLGKNNIVLHKDVGCQECFAHNCKKGFACLEAISVEEVFSAAKELLGILSLCAIK